MLGQAEEDLLHTAKDIIPDANDSKPRSVALRRTYNPEDPSQSNSFETQCLSEKGKVVALVTQQLRADAYRQASSILMHGNEKIIDDVSYAGDLFKDKFQYPWGQSPPGYIDDGSFMKVKLDALGYFEDGKTNTVDDFVKDTLLKDVSIPEWTAGGMWSMIYFFSLTRLSRVMLSVAPGPM
ncbi:hypothetical protein CPB84DRAFT_1782927 [Gymnopilus junonius]|uniref:Uncharacterized protein n=1 Tax=Gymnopilus junonius TaxID=109634 RepID=A0A9P5NLK5_GYMJU|nr:hypothetical protein CPB84DRAFT_1782927 [Gymnopilus junonius]